MKVSIRASRIPRDKFRFCIIFMMTVNPTAEVRVSARVKVMMRVTALLWLVLVLCL